MTPVGILRPPLAKRCLYGGTAPVTSDGLGERLAQWWESVRQRCAPRTTWGIHLAHGPATHRQRPPCLQRLVDVVPHYPRTVRLASSPPSPSHDNPSERWGGMLEHQWNGTGLDAMDTRLALARTMTWQGQHPVVALVSTV